MEDSEIESVRFDDSFEVQCVIYEMLQTTISKAIDDELKKVDAPPLMISKEIMLKNILARNIDSLEDQQYLTIGPEGKTYLCGSWLMRPVITPDGSFISTMDYIKAHMDCSNLIFLPNKTGIDMRKEMWFAKNQDYTSYNLPKECRIDSPTEGMMPIEMMNMPKGPPPGFPQGFPSPQVTPEATSEPASSIDEVVQAFKDEIKQAIIETITTSIKEDSYKNNLPLPESIDTMAAGIAGRNISAMEKSNYVFVGPDNKIYACGDWLLRQVVMGNAKLPCIARLKQKFYKYDMIEYRPADIGTRLQAQMQK